MKKKNKETPKVHRQKTYDLTLTKFEILHIRDLFSVLLPPDGSQTLSQSLAELEGRGLIESKLWAKVSALCEAAELPIDAEAPDYIIAPTSSPTLGVFHINHDLAESESSEDETGFLPSDESETEVEDEDDEDE
jgi:hypothetical protein